MAKLPISIHQIKIAQTAGALVPVNLTTPTRNSEEMAKVIAAIFNTLLSYIKPTSHFLFRDRIKHKLMTLNVIEMSGKNMVPTSRIGQAVSTVKNLLNGQDPKFINDVLQRVQELF